MTRTFLAALMVLMIASCGGGGLRPNIAKTGGPDEFSVLPSRPLDIPQNLSVLPAPTPGGVNLTDPNPVGDAVVALGGRQTAAGGIPASEAALVTVASRYGVAPGIRGTVAAEDAQFRRNRGRFSLFGGGNYYRAYASQALNAYAELIRFRNLGVQVPSAPPGN